MTHPEWLAFLHAVVADPVDDTPRLVAADWLDEHGQPDRAAFIRVQVELARLAAAGRGQTREAESLRRKERAYIGPAAYHGPLWAADDVPELVRVRPKGAGVWVDRADRVRYRRGFVDEVWCPAGEWLRHGAVVRERLPVRTVYLTGCGDLTRDDWYALLPTLLRVDHVGLDTDPHGFLDWIRHSLPGTLVEAAGPAG